MPRVSCIYEGWVRHRRLRPVDHTFRVPLFLMYLDLDELPDLFRGRWLWSTRRPALARFRRRDYLGDPDRPLKDAVKDVVEERTGHRPRGPVRLLTHLRYFGYAFNPVSLYYCFDERERVQAIVAEVSNTPWNERHLYVVDRGDRESLRFEVPKEFHVSPFMAMDHDYEWAFNEPGPRLAVHMASRRRGELHFDATLGLRRRAINARSLARVLLRYPFMTLRVMAGIYWQAARLKWKRCPFHTHPAKTLTPQGSLR